MTLSALAGKQLSKEAKCFQVQGNPSNQNHVREISGPLPAQTGQTLVQKMTRPQPAIQAHRPADLPSVSTRHIPNLSGQWCLDLSTLRTLGA